jgi:hypothetical protein
MKSHVKAVGMGLAIAALAILIYNKSPMVKKALGGAA